MLLGFTAIHAPSLRCSTCCGEISYLLQHIPAGPARSSSHSEGRPWSPPVSTAVAPFQRVVGLLFMTRLLPHKRGWSRNAWRQISSSWCYIILPCLKSHGGAWCQIAGPTAINTMTRAFSSIWSLMWHTGKSVYVRHGRLLSVPLGTIRILKVIPRPQPFLISTSRTGTFP